MIVFCIFTLYRSSDSSSIYLQEFVIRRTEVVVGEKTLVGEFQVSLIGEFGGGLFCHLSQTFHSLPFPFLFSSLFLFLFFLCEIFCELRIKNSNLLFYYFYFKLRWAILFRFKFKSVVGFYTFVQVGDFLVCERLCGNLD